MKAMHIARSAAAAALVALLAGCGKSALTSPQPDSELTTTQANALATQMGVVAVAAGLDAPVGVPAVTALRRAPDTFRRSTAMFDTTITDGGATLSFSVQFFDAGGTEQPGFDEQTTDRIHATSWLRGEYADANGLFTLGSGAEWDATGLAPGSDRQTTNGSRADSVHWEYQDDSTSASYTTRATGDVRSVVRMKPIGEGYPLSGSIRWTLFVDLHVVANSGSADHTLRGSALVTFNGTRFVPLVLNGRHHYTLDLDTGEVTPVAS